jgi:hypothetical protein
MAKQQNKKRPKSDAHLIQIIQTCTTTGCCGLSNSALVPQELFQKIQFAQKTIQVSPIEVRVVCFKDDLMKAIRASSLFYIGMPLLADLRNGWVFDSRTQGFLRTATKDDLAKWRDVQTKAGDQVKGKQ